MVAYFVFPLKQIQHIYRREDIENPRLKTEQEAIAEALRLNSNKYAYGVFAVRVVSQEKYQLESEVVHIVYRGKLYSPPHIDIV